MISLQRIRKPLSRTDRRDRVVMFRQLLKSDPSLREAAFELGCILGDDATRLSGIDPSSDLAEAIREISAQLR